MTFAVFIAIDAWIQHARAVKEARQAPVVAAPASSEPVWVAGFQLPEELHYHKGHTWALPVSAETVLVGIDDFARRLIGGKASALTTPKAGTWVRQGDQAFSVEAEGRTAHFVSPVEGEVVDVNPGVRGQAGLVSDEPTAAAGS